MKDLESIRAQAEALWPLGWEIDEDEAQIFANNRVIDLSLDFGGEPPTISLSCGEQALLDDESFADLETALRMAYNAWRQLVAQVPALNTTPADAERQAERVVKIARQVQQRDEEE
jgi:hypothetical protein